MPTRLLSSPASLISSDIHQQCDTVGYTPVTTAKSGSVEKDLPESRLLSNPAGLIAGRLTCPAIGLPHLGSDPDLNTSRFLKLLGLPMIEGFPFPNPSPSSSQMPGRRKKMFILHSHPTCAAVCFSLAHFLVPALPDSQTPRSFDSSQPANCPCLPSAVDSISVTCPHRDGLGLRGFWGHCPHQGIQV